MMLVRRQNVNPKAIHILMSNKGGDNATGGGLGWENKHFLMSSIALLYFDFPPFFPFMK